METTKGALRNMTSGILHTDIGEVYKFIEKFVKAEGIMTHHLPSASQALKPMLRARLSLEWFTKEWVKNGLDEMVEIADLTDAELKEFWNKFNELTS